LSLKSSESRAVTNHGHYACEDSNEPTGDEADFTNDDARRLALDPSETVVRDDTDDPEHQSAEGCELDDLLSMPQDVSTETDGKQLPSLFIRLTYENEEGDV
jgi:hypothetical protein